MKEDNFAEMSLARLHQLKTTWTTQMRTAEEAGKLSVAKQLHRKLALINYQINKKSQDNLNDLFS